jgi:hypothetical protein
VVDTVCQAFGHGRGVVTEEVGGVAGEPPAGRFHSHRQVPVVESRFRRDSGGQKPVDEAVVVVEARRVHARVGARLRDDASPGDREPVAVEAETGEQCDVLVEPMIAVRSRFCCAAVDDISRSVDEVIPDGAPAPISGACSFDLESGRGRGEAQSCQRLSIERMNAVHASNMSWKLGGCNRPAASPHRGRSGSKSVCGRWWT